MEKLPVLPLIIVLLLSILIMDVSAIETTSIVVTPAGTPIPRVDTRLQSYTTTLFLDRASAQVIFRFVFDEVHEDGIPLTLPFSISNVSLLVDGFRQDPHIQRTSNSSYITIPLTGETRQVLLGFSIPSEGKQDSYDFLMSSFEAPFDSALMKTIVYLPPGARLPDSLDRADSLIPAPSSIDTKGDRVVISWEARDVKRGFVMNPFLMFHQDKRSSPYPVLPSLLGFVLLSVLLVIVFFFMFPTVRRRMTRSPLPTPRPLARKDVIPERYFKEEEMQVITVLRRRGGCCPQSQLSLITDISKATLSRLLFELEARNVVYRKAQGKKNLVYLKEEL